MANPTIRDVQLLLAAGINPVTGLPTRSSTGKGELFEAAKKAIRLIDEQDAVNRFRWYNLPSGISSQELERLIYYKGQLAFFYYADLDKFFFMPYALDGTLDFYGRFNKIHPVPMNASDDKKAGKALEALLSTVKLEPMYDVVGEDETVDPNKVCVLLHDYTKQLSQTIIPRCTINEGIIEYEAQLLPLSRTALIAACGVRGVRVPDADASGQVIQASGQIKDSAIKGDIYVPMQGTLDFQDMAGAPSGKVQDFFLALQSVENFRLSTYGLENGGLFEKKAHVLESEQAMNQSKVGRVLQDGLSIRQRFCNIVNSVFDLGLWCEPAENVSEADMNGDGVLYDRDVEGGAPANQEEPSDA